MRYNISTSTAPKMPTLGRGTECIKLLLSQASKDMHEPLVPMLFPSLGAHMSGAEFQYPDNKWLEMCGQMANLVADSGCNKGQLSYLVDAICHDFSEHDELELKKLVEWQKQVKTKAANKEKPMRPEVSFWFPPSDITKPAFLQNATPPESASSCNCRRFCPRSSTTSCHPTARTSATTTSRTSARHPNRPSLPGW